MPTPFADYHVMPINDEITHIDTRTCWCQPTLEEGPEGIIVIHHSADGREADDPDACPPATRH